MKAQVQAGSRHWILFFWMCQWSPFIMVNKCSVFACNSNKKGHENKAVFRLPVKSETRTKWFRFLNRKDLKEDASFIFICELHFEEKFLNRNKERTRLIKFPEPIPTIYPKELVEEKPSVLPTSSTTRKPPFPRVFQPDEIESKAYQELKISSLSDVNDGLLKFLDKGYKYVRNSNNVVCYKLEEKNDSIFQPNSLIYYVDNRVARDLIQNFSSKIARF